MQLSIITLPTLVANEAEAIRELLAEGTCRIHLRKPNATADALRRCLDAMHPDCFANVVMHYYPQLVDEYGLAGFHFNKKNVEQLSNCNYRHQSYSAHTFEEALSMQHYRLDYCFLSPIFESISKEGYASTFTIDELRTFIGTAPSTLKLFALGGISAETIAQTKALGFTGAALLGAVWQNFAADASVADVVFHYKKIKQLCDLL